MKLRDTAFGRWADSRQKALRRHGFAGEARFCPTCCIILALRSCVCRALAQAVSGMAAVGAAARDELATLLKPAPSSRNKHRRSQPLTRNALQPNVAIGEPPNLPLRTGHTWRPGKEALRMPCTSPQRLLLPALLIFVGLLVGAVSGADAVDYGGVEFPLGDRSFADDIVAFTIGSEAGPPCDDPTHALGDPGRFDWSDVNYVSLGEGGSLTVRFIDNALVDQTEVEDGLDLFVFETGPVVEWFQVEISKDGIAWIDLGVVQGQPTGLDIGPYCEPGDAFYYVRITDDPTQQQTSYPYGGADVDAVGAIGSTPVPGTVSFTGFEASCHPWSRFAAGPGEAAVWRQALAADPLAHSGVHAVSAEVSGHAIAGLRLALPVEPAGAAAVLLQSWVYVDERTEGESSTFFGFSFSEEYPESGAGWEQNLGWDVSSATSSELHLLDVSQPVDDGLAASGWHLVRVQYVPLSCQLTLWVDGQEVAVGTAAAAAGSHPCGAVLGTLGASAGARQTVLFDDVQLRLFDHPGQSTGDRPFALLQGHGNVAADQTWTYDLWYGNGYPIFGLEPLTDTESERVHVGVSLPDGYTFLGSDPGPDRVVGGAPVWDVSLPTMGQMSCILLDIATPTSVAEQNIDRVWVWATTNEAAELSGPPDPVNWTSPSDVAWGPPRDVLPQSIETVARPDLWVSKRGPRVASPGDAISYSIAAGNSGSMTARGASIRDVMPDLLGGGDIIVGSLAEAVPGDSWQAVIGCTLPQTISVGSVLLNQAYAPALPDEANVGNNIAQWQTVVDTAPDPNRLSVLPEGGVDRGDELAYTLECRNQGSETAYGVHATLILDEQLDDTSLVVADPNVLSYDDTSRTLVWDVGTLEPSGVSITSFVVNVAAEALRARTIVGQAHVSFPSLLEEAPTNLVVSVVLGSFPDVPVDFWALLQIELAYDNGIVAGYGDGLYRPEWSVTRDQMAVYICRALAGGDENVPDGPSTATFDDVPTDHWAYKHVEYCVAEGVVGGYDPVTYAPTITVSRDQMSVFISRAVAGGDEDVPDGPAIATFDDVPTGHWAYKYVEYCADNNIVGGYDPVTYAPTITVTRDQMAVFICRAFELPT